MTDLAILVSVLFALSVPVAQAGPILAKSAKSVKSANSEGKPVWDCTKSRADHLYGGRESQEYNCSTVAFFPDTNDFLVGIWTKYSSPAWGKRDVYSSYARIFDSSGESRSFLKSPDGSPYNEFSQSINLSQTSHSEERAARTTVFSDRGLAGGVDGLRFRVWNREGVSVKVLDIFNHGIHNSYTPSFSPDSLESSSDGERVLVNTHLIYGSYDYGMILLDRDFNFLPGVFMAMSAATFSPDEKRIVGIADPGRVLVMDRDGNFLSDQPFAATSVPIHTRRLYFSDSGRFLVSRDGRRWAIWKSTGGAPVELDLGWTSPVFSPVEAKYLTARLNERAAIWNADGSLFRQLEEIQGYACGQYRYSGNGELIVGVMYPGCPAKEWDNPVVYGKSKLAVWNKEGKLIASRDYFDVASVYPDYTKIDAVGWERVYKNATLISDDGSQIYLITPSGNVEVWNPYLQMTTEVLTGPKNYLVALRLSPDRSTLLGIESEVFDSFGYRMSSWGAAIWMWKR